MPELPKLANLPGNTRSDPILYELFPDQVVAAAVDKNAAAIAYTYSEAVTWFEYMMDTARRARKKHCQSLISNGYINPDLLSELCTVLDAANINLKPSMTPFISG
ncbi:MAG: hypothetical protein R2875_02345 [Desulfobacterales bacterium]